MSNKPETHNFGQGERLTASGKAETKREIDRLPKLLESVSKHKICKNCGITYPKEEKKCPHCGSEKVF